MQIIWRGKERKQIDVSIISKFVEIPKFSMIPEQSQELISIEGRKKYTNTQVYHSIDVCITLMANHKHTYK